MDKRFVPGRQDLLAIEPVGLTMMSAWSSALAGPALLHPAITDSIKSILPPELSVLAIPANVALALGVSILGMNKIRRTWIREVMYNQYFESPVRIRSEQQVPTEDIKKWNGICTGFRVEDGMPIIVDWNEWMQHNYILGASGMGKTVMMEWFMYQQLIHGGGIIFMDGKIDESNIHRLYAMCVATGRASDFLVINPGNPKMSNTYNPILFGDPDEKASRILGLIPSTETNPGADHYKQTSLQALTTLMKAFEQINYGKETGHPRVKGKAFNFMDIAILLNNTKALRELEEMVPDDIGREFKIWIEQFKFIRDGRVDYDLKKMRDLFGGIAGRVYQFGSGSFGEITNTYDPEVDLFEAITNNKILYVALPTMGKGEAASNFGKMFIGDYRTAVSWIQALPKKKRPWPPTMCIFDEAGAYATPNWSRIFEQARSAHQALVIGTQTIANLEEVSKEFASMVLGNAFNKMIFRLGDYETIDKVTKLIGQEIAANVNFGIAQSESDPSNSDQMNITGDETTSSNTNLTLRESEFLRVRPTTITRLAKGECIHLYGNHDIYHIKIPFVAIDDDFLAQNTPKINRRVRREVNGLSLLEKYQKYITVGDGDE